MNSYLWLQTIDGYIQKVEELVMYSPVICKDVIRNGKGCSKECAVLLPACVTTATLDSILDYLRFYHVKGRSQEV
jgi:S-phase kinase-associated protein 1